MSYQDLIFFCFALGLLVLAIKFGNRKRKYLEKNGIRSSAKVISIEKTLITIHDHDASWTPVMKIVLGIKVAGTEYRQVTVKQEFLTSQTPKPGDEVDVLIDPRNPDKVVIVNKA